MIAEVDLLLGAMHFVIVAGILRLMLIHAGRKDPSDEVRAAPEVWSALPTLQPTTLHETVSEWSRAWQWHGVAWQWRVETRCGLRYSLVQGGTVRHTPWAACLISVHACNARVPTCMYNESCYMRQIAHMRSTACVTHYSDTATSADEKIYNFVTAFRELTYACGAQCDGAVPRGGPPPRIFPPGFRGAC